MIYQVYRMLRGEPSDVGPQEQRTAGIAGVRFTDPLEAHRASARLTLANNEMLMKGWVYTVQKMDS
jgi:hypothetical protein